MIVLSELFNFIDKAYPMLLSPTDLVSLGLYQSASDVSHSVKRGQAPPHLRLGYKKMVFPKATLLKWLQCKNSTETPRAPRKKETKKRRKSNVSRMS